MSVFCVKLDMFHKFIIRWCAEHEATVASYLFRHVSSSGSFVLVPKKMATRKFES